MATSNRLSYALAAAFSVAVGVLISQHNMLVAQSEQLTADRYQIKSQRDQLQLQTERLQAQSDNLATAGISQQGPVQLASQSELPAVIVSAARSSDHSR
jgi:cell division protein FtsL